MEEITEKKLYAATFVKEPTPMNTAWSLKGGTASLIDKMIVPGNYRELVEMCRFFYEHDGFAYTTVNKNVEIGINGYSLNQGTCSEKELAIYSYVDSKMQEFLEEAALEFLVSGLVIPEVEWGPVSGTEIDPKYRRQYQLPTNFWHRDPLSIDMRKTPIPNKLSVFVDVPEEDVWFILNNGVYADGTEDRETYEELKKQYPSYVRDVKRGVRKFKLDNPTVIRRYTKSGSVWPTPYMTPALELMMHKRNLRKMDYSIAARVISAIMLFKLGNDEYPLTEDDDDVIEDLKTQMLWRGMSGNVERVFQLFSNHTLAIEWITPDVKALLDEGKYRSVNEDILIALGLPRIVVAGESSRSGSSNAEIAMLPPTNTIEAMREQLLVFPKAVYREVQRRNGFKGIPEPYYPPIRLQNLSELIEIGRGYYENGIISRTGWAEMGKIDFGVEMQRIAAERDQMEALGLEEYAPVPFSPKPDKVQPDKAKPEKEKDQEGE